MSHKKLQSKVKDEKMPYFRSYKHRGHDGTRQGHTEWKNAGELYFASEQEFLLARVLNGTFDPMPLVESWPCRPEDWTPTIIGEPNVSENEYGGYIPTQEDIESKQIRLLTIEDKKSQLETRVEKLKKDIIVQTPVKDKDETDQSKSPEPDQSTDSGGIDNTDLQSKIQDLENEILRCRVKAQNMRSIIEKDQAKLYKAISSRGSNRWQESDIIFQDNTRMKPVTVYAHEMETAGDKLNLWMSATASDVIKGSIKKMAVGYKGSSVNAFIVLDRLNLRFGKDTTATGNVGMIGRAVSLKFLYGKESATDYLDKMLDMLEEVVGYDELVETVKAALPVILLGRIHNPRYGSYCELATKILLDKEFKEMSLGPYKDFRAMLYTTEQTMKCFAKSKNDFKYSMNSKKQDQERANASKSVPSKKKKGGGETKKKAPYCHNCDNNKTLL